VKPYQLIVTFLLLALTVLGTAGCRYVPSFVLARQLDFRPAKYNVHVEHNVPMNTSDGIRLVSDIYLPKKSSPSPTILVRINFAQTIKNTFFSGIIARLWAERGYNVVIQGTRGRYKSTGIFYPLVHERKDGIETLAWLRKQDWFDGRLGMWGGSYFGYTQWVLADQVDPGTSAFLIQISSNDWHGMFYPGGAFSLESALYWALWSAGDGSKRPSADVLERGFNGFPLIEADDRAIGNVSFFNDWVRHPEKDGYWDTIDDEKRASSLRSPVLLMAGWYDPFLPTEIADFKRIRNTTTREASFKSRLIIGPWSHARSVAFPNGFEPRNYRLESLAPSLDWFDHHLSARKNQIRKRAPVEIFVMGKNEWREEQEWPLARTQYTLYYLRSGGNANGLSGDGTLTRALPTSDGTQDTYIYDPKIPVPSQGGAMFGPRAGIKKQNQIEERKDVLVYTTEPLKDDLEITGPISLRLFVSTSAPNTDFTGKLVDVHPDGSAYNVCDGIVRRSYNKGLLPIEIQIDLWPTSMVFFKGHRIRLEVSSSNFPRFDRNPNTGRPVATETNPVTATQTVHHGQLTPSRIILPVIEARAPSN